MRAEYSFLEKFEKESADTLERGCDFVGSSSSHKSGGRIARLLKRPVRDIRRFVSRLFDQSLTAAAASGLRLYFMQLRLRVAGMFLLTFGAYSSAVSLLLRFFTSREADGGAVYFGIFLAASSIPLLLSQKSIAASLTDSRAGSIVCEYLGIRRETLGGDGLCGRMSHGFIAGVICGTLTFAFSPSDTLGFILLLAAVCIILTVPEAGPMMCAALLMWCDTRVHCVILGATLVSYILKLVRGKRSFALRRSDAVCAVFALSVAFSTLFSSGNMGTGDILVRLLLISAYFLTVLLYRSCRSVIRLLTATVVFAGLFAAVYVLGAALTLLIPASLGADRGYLLSAVSSFYVFSDGSAELILAAVLPVAIGLALRHHNVIPRPTLWLSAAASCACLILRGAYAYLAAAAVAVTVMLLMLGRRRVYLALSLILGAAVLLMYADGLWQNIFGYIYDNIYAAFSASNGIFHGGLTLPEGWLWGGGGVPAGADFYLQLLAMLGIPGCAVFAAFLLVTLREVAWLMWRTVSTGASHGELRRFGAIRSAADTRIGAGAPACAAFALLLCGIFCNVWQSDAAFMLLWVLCGSCAAYVRNADFEMSKAENAAAAADSAERSFCDMGA